jgi:hypothetical protein
LRQLARIRAATLATSLGAAFLLSGARASAQSDPAAASSLFSEARKLAAQKKYAEACPKFEESQRLDPGIGTQFNLADCWEQIGRTASAWALYQDVAAAAKGSGQPERERVARERAEKLAPKLSRLKLIVRANHPGLEIARDGITLGAAVWNTDVPVDPGAHRIEARAPAHEPWNETVQVAADGATSTVTVPPLKPAPAEAPAAASAPSSTLLPASDSAYGAGGSQRMLGFVVGGVGVAGVLAGGFFGVRALSKNHDAKEICEDRPSACSDAEQGEHAGLVEDAKSARTLSIVGFAAGGAALGAGLVLILTAPRSEVSAARAVRLTPMLGAGSAGAGLAGRF